MAVAHTSAEETLCPPFQVINYPQGSHRRGNLHKSGAQRWRSERLISDSEYDAQQVVDHPKVGNPKQGKTASRRLRW